VGANREAAMEALAKSCRGHETAAPR